VSTREDHSGLYGLAEQAGYIYLTGRASINLAKNRFAAGLAAGAELDRDGKYAGWNHKHIEGPPIPTQGFAPGELLNYTYPTKQAVKTDSSKHKQGAGPGPEKCAYRADNREKTSKKQERTGWPRLDPGCSGPDPIGPHTQGKHRSRTLPVWRANG